MKSIRQLGRTALSVVLTAGAVVGMTTTATAGEDTEALCVVNFGTVGNAVVMGVGLEVPFPNVGGGPFVETELNAIPKSYALASGAHEGNLGEIVLGTSGVYPENPTQAKAFFPPTEGAESTAKKEQGPFASSTAETGPGLAKATAMAFGAPPGGASTESGMGPSRAEAVTKFTGKVLSGRDEAVGYDIRLGAARIDMLRSVIDYSTDGTTAGTTGSWKLEFFGIHNADQPGGTFTGDGITLQGGDAQPGSDGREQFNDGVAKLSDALETAGVGRMDVTVQPGKVEIGAGTLDIEGSGLVVRSVPGPTQGSSLHAFSVIFGHTERRAQVDLGTCDASVESYGSGGDAPATKESH